MRSPQHTDRIVASGVFSGTFAAVLCCSAIASAQAVEPTRDPVAITAAQRSPITPEQRRDWFVRGVVGPTTVGAAVLGSTWKTAMDSPEEWNGASGFSKRFLAYEAEAGISKGIEAGLGAFWGEDPRRERSRSDGFSGRLGFAIKTVVLAPRSDGQLAPAWGRYAGAVGSSLIETTWLPHHARTPRATAGRIASSFVSRLAVNVLTEFGPDMRRGLAKAVGATRGKRPHNIGERAEPSASRETSTIRNVPQP